MASFHFLIVCGLNLVLIPCEGKITSPTVGTNYTFLPGSSANITWTFSDETSAVSSRTWTFTSSDGLRSGALGGKISNFPLQVRKDILPGVDIKLPGTLLLNNVNHSYDGTYKFTLVATETDESNVIIYIAKKPNVTFSCSSPITVNKSDDFTCVCRGEGGRPPADVTWYKKDVQIGETKKENNTLTVTNVDVTDSGTYKCVAQSYHTDAYKDEKSIQVMVNSEPYDTAITVDPAKAEVDEKVTIACKSEGVPPLIYTITHVETGTVYNGNALIIPNVQLNDAGTYECFVWNTLGNDSVSVFLTVVEESRPTQPSPKSKTTSKKSMVDKNGNKTVIKSPDPPMESDSTPIGLIIGIIIGVLLLLLIVGIVVYCYKSKGKDRSNHGNIDPVAGNHYELDEEPSPGDNAYDTVGPMGQSGSKKKAPEKDSLPPVYAAVDKNNRQGNTLYASLDTDALKQKRESKKEPADRTPQTEYASIDFAKTTDVPKADLV